MILYVYFNDVIYIFTKIQIFAKSIAWCHISHFILEKCHNFQIVSFIFKNIQLAGNWSYIKRFNLVGGSKVSQSALLNNMVTSPRRSKRTRKGGVRITTSKRTRGQEAAPSTDLVEPVADSGRVSILHIPRAFHVFHLHTNLSRRVVRVRSFRPARRSGSAIALRRTIAASAVNTAQRRSEKTATGNAPRIVSSASRFRLIITS